MRASCVLIGLALVACGGPTPTPDREPVSAEVTVVVEPDPIALQAGPMLGHNTQREVVVWAQTTAPADVSLRYWPVAGEGVAWTTEPVRADAETAFTAHLVASLLEPGATYGYEVLTDGASATAGRALTFTTQPLWQWRTDPPDVTIAFGSCNYVNEPEYDRPGDPYGQGYDIFDRIAEREPNLMVWLGDNVYLREADWWSADGMAHRYTHTRSLSELQHFLASTHHYATWDDHDYGPDDSDWTYPLRDVALTLFEEFWANPSYGLSGVPGVFTQFAWSDVEFFLLDDRWYRSPRDVSDGEMLGEAQLEWVLDALTTSRARFKIVGNGSQVLNPMAPYEAFARYPAEREALIDGIVSRGIEGVVFISGDRHHAELIRVETEGFYPLYDLTSSPLTAGPGDARNERDNPNRVEGTLVTERNFGLVEVSGAPDARELTLRIVGTDGVDRWEHTIPASELTVPE